ncbi:MAG: hypothetical protein JXA87_11195 [Thermoleophilia bacterium]|nr:hypothetical protein [Thermoleophilia bacterium]
MEEQQGQESEIRDSEAERAEEAVMMERLQEEIRNLPVGDHLLFMMQSLSGLAVARMDLSTDNTARRDMDQARLAIDAFKALLELLEKAKPAGEMATHRGMLSQLQLAYVGALDEGDKPAGEDAGEAAPEGGPGEANAEDGEAAEDGEGA